MSRPLPTLGNPKNTIEVLNKYKFIFQKKFGQNFLIDEHVLGKIIRSAEITEDDFVVEIGPGIGTLTQYLAASAREVAAIEIDDALIPILEETLEELKTREPDTKKYRARVVLVGSEVDDVDVVKLIEDCGAYVCADRFCYGSFPGRDEIILTEDEDALTQICRQYMNRAQCARYMNQEKIQGRRAYVAKLAEEYHADGIIYEQMKFCDPWAYERTVGTQVLRDEYHYAPMRWVIPASFVPVSRPSWRASRLRKSREVGNNGKRMGKRAAGKLLHHRQGSEPQRMAGTEGHLL